MYTYNYDAGVNDYATMCEQSIFEVDCYLLKSSIEQHQFLSQFGKPLKIHFKCWLLLFSLDETITKM